MISFSNFDKSESDTTHFDVENCNSSFVKMQLEELLLLMYKLFLLILKITIILI